MNYTINTRRFNNAFVNVTPWLTEPDTAAPPIPVQNLHISSIGNDFIELSWAASPLGDLSGYKICYKTDTTEFFYTDTIDVGNVTSYSLSGLLAGSTYYIAAICYDNDGNHSWYSEEVLSIDNIPPNTPTGLQAARIIDGIKLIWRKNCETDFQYYAIYKSSNVDFNPDSFDYYDTTVDTFYIDLETDSSKFYYYAISAFDYAGNESNISDLVYLEALSINRPDVVIRDYHLYNNFPNPFNPTTTISYQLPKTSFVKLTIYDISGRSIQTLIDEKKNAGYYSVEWNAENVCSGVYFYRIEAGDFVAVKKGLLVK